MMATAFLALIGAAAQAGPPHRYEVSVESVPASGKPLTAKDARDAKGSRRETSVEGKVECLAV
jgi:hypothetical protein